MKENKKSDYIFNICMIVVDIRTTNKILEDQKTFSVYLLSPILLKIQKKEEKTDPNEKRRKVEKNTKKILEVQTIFPQFICSPLFFCKYKREKTQIQMKKKTSSKIKMTGGTPEVRSDKSLTILTFKI